MDTLELLLRDDGNYKQGVYWCIRRGDSPSGRLQSLLRRDRVYLVEIDGFDQFTADLHEVAGLALPKPIARPLDMARDRARLFVEVEDSSLKAHPIISTHVQEVLANLNSYTPTLPLEIKATILSSMGEVGDAIPVWEQAYNEDPENAIIAARYADALAEAGKDRELAEFVDDSPLPVTNKTYYLLRAGRNEAVLDLAGRSLAEPVATKSGWNENAAIIRINRAIALKRLGRTNEMKADLDFLEQNEDTVEPNVEAGVAALRRDRQRLFAALDESLHKTITPKQLRVFPVFEDYRDDPDFRKLWETESPANWGTSASDGRSNGSQASRITNDRLSGDVDDADPLPDSPSPQ